MEEKNIIDRGISKKISIRGKREYGNCLPLHHTVSSGDHTLPPRTEGLRRQSGCCVYLFHEIPSFPEKSYGCLNFEQEAADGVKKELNGSLFRGVKVRVEDGRPDTFVPRGIPSEEVEGEKKKKKRAKKGGEMIERKLKKKARRRVWLMVLSFRIGRFREGRVSRLVLLYPQREMASGIVFPEFPLLPPPTVPTSTTTFTQRTKEKKIDGSIKGCMHHTRLP